MGSILKAVILPSLGGDTCFGSMFAAYDALSEPMKKMLEGLSATHDISNTLERGIQSGNVDVDAEEMKENWPPVKHPVIQRHPRTGRKALFVHRNATVRIDGLTDRENEVLLPLLCDHIRDPLYQCRYRWDTGTVVFWDNRAAQHYAVPDYDERRVMHRVTVDDYRAIRSGG